MTRKPRTSKRSKARDAAFKLDQQVQWTCYLLKQYAASLERVGGTAYADHTEGNYYDALLERFASLLWADADGKPAEGFTAALLRTMPKIEVTPQTAAPIESLLPA